ncbi:MAG TPA: NB-ARC domain-containing protein, partial [Ktedonobacteraceae bacterium]|nr:NB-ARC domain-containing protein [Ktedonobacteraceae bacterium]
MDPPDGKHSPQPEPEPRTRLTQARVRMKLSQKQVAERIGTTHVNVSRWERGITKPGSYFRRRLVQLFGRTEEELDLSRTSDSLPSLSPSPSSTSSSSVPADSIIDPTIPLLPTNPLVGRGEMLAKLKQRLRSGGNVTLTALNGLPGVGKTTLAITIAHDADIQAHFRDGILWAGLGPQPNLSGIAGHWAGLLGISQSEIEAASDAASWESWAIAMRRAIGSRRMLLVIDDAWKDVDPLLLKVGGPNCAHLVTTRYPSIANQLGIKSAFAIRELGEEDSVQLLRILAPQLMEYDSQRAHELAHAVGGLPLALTLAGNYLRRHTYSGQPRRVEAALTRLSSAVERLSISEPHSATERHPSLPLDTPISLQSVIAVTDAQLKVEQQAALRALSVFPPKPDSFSEEAALYVADCSTDTLDYLVDTGLLEWSEHGRYTMHQTIADYARSRLDNDSIPSARLADYMSDFVPVHRKDYDLLDRESSAILVALEAAHNLGKGEALMRTIYAYIPYLLARSQYYQAETHLRRAYDAADRKGDTYGKAG